MDILDCPQVPTRQTNAKPRKVDWVLVGSDVNVRPDSPVVISLPAIGWTWKSIVIKLERNDGSSLDDKSRQLHPTATLSIKTRFAPRRGHVYEQYTLSKLPLHSLEGGCPFEGPCPLLQDGDDDCDTEPLSAWYRLGWEERWGEADSRLAEMIIPYQTPSLLWQVQFSGLGSWDRLHMWANITPVMRGEETICPRYVGVFPAKYDTLQPANNGICVHGPGCVPARPLLFRAETVDEFFFRRSPEGQEVGMRPPAPVLVTALMDSLASYIDVVRNAFKRAKAGSRARAEGERERHGSERAPKAGKLKVTVGDEEEEDESDLFRYSSSSHSHLPLSKASSSSSSLGGRFGSAFGGVPETFEEFE